MSTLNSSQAGTPLTSHVAVTKQGQQLASNSRFAHDTTSSNQASSTINANVQSDTPSYRNLSIEFPACAQSSLSMELTHNGKVTELVARFESYANYSDESKETHKDHTCASSTATYCPSEFETQTVQGTVDEYKHSVGDDEEQQGARKPIPAQWLPKSHGPNLATARRAKERSHKFEAHGLGTTAVTIRDSRGSLKLGKHGTENITFLTKEALAAVENNLTTPTSHSPSKVYQPPSKQSRPSPNVSPQRNSTHRHTKFTIKTSPTRKNFLSADLAPPGHSRTSSSATTSMGGNSFYTAEGSPVRGSADSDVSFESAAEILEEIGTVHNDVHANSENAQGGQSPRKDHPSSIKAAPDVISDTVKPKLSLVIPLSSSSESDDQAARALISATSKSITTVVPGIQNSPGQTSRIPRVSTTSKTGSARSAIRSSTLKRVQSVKTLAPKTRAPENHLEDSDHSNLSTSPALSLCNVRTVDSSGTTPILSSTSMANDFTYSYSAGCVLCTDKAAVQTRPNELEKPATRDHAIVGSASQENVMVSKQLSRATSNAAMKAPLSSQNAFLEKKCDVLGTSNEDNISNETASVTQERDCTTGVTDSASPVRGRTERYLPGVRRQAESQHSMHSSLGSDLRATAPEFVPQVRATQYPDAPLVGPIAVPPPGSGTDLDMFALDKHGIPWAYYMYPIQFAYEQGFRNGRSRSPRKFKPKKQRPLISSPTDVQNRIQHVSFPTTDIRLEVDASTSVTQRQSDAILMPSPPVPAYRLERLAKGENSHPGTTTQGYLELKANTGDRSGTFAPRTDMSAQQLALGELSNRNTPQLSNFGSVATHSVPFLAGPRDIKTSRYNTVSYRGPRRTCRNTGNGLYSGRGAAGVPMDATFPFPDPLPPQGRPEQSQIHHNSRQQHTEYSIGSEACGLVDILIAAEKGGGEACNTCAPDH